MGHQLHLQTLFILATHHKSITAVTSKVIDPLNTEREGIIEDLHTREWESWSLLETLPAPRVQGGAKVGIQL